MYVFKGTASNEKISLCVRRLVPTCPFIWATSKLSIGHGEISRTSGMWLPLGGLGSLPRAGDQATDRPRGREHHQEKRTGEEEREGGTHSIHFTAGVQEREWLLLLPLPAHASFILGPSSSITSAVGL